MKKQILVMLFLSVGIVSFGQKKDRGITNNKLYDTLYKSKACPLCHKKENVIPIIYGKPGKGLIKLAEMGNIKLGGCIVSEKSPKFYCKTDKFEF